MTTQPHLSFRLQDRVEGIQDSAVDLQPFLGQWLNTNPETDGVAEITIREEGASLVIRVRGASGSTPREWGEVTPEAVFCDGPNSSRGMAFSATFDFGSSSTKLGGNVNQGLLVVAFWSQHADQGGQARVFNREFFRLLAIGERT